MQGSLKKLHVGYIELSFADPENVETYNEKLDKDQQKFDEIREQIVEAIHDYEMTAAPAPTDQPETDGGRKAKPNVSLKPRVLTKEATPIELRHWIGKFRAILS